MIETIMDQNRGKDSIMENGNETGEFQRKRQMTEASAVMDTDVGFAVPTSSESAVTTPDGSRHNSEAIQQPEPPSVQSRNDDDVIIVHSDDDPFDLSDLDDDDLVAALAKVELDDANMRKAADERLRLAFPSEDAAQTGPWRLLSPSQFEKENGRWPSKADYDACCLLIRGPDGGLAPKPKYYESVRARFSSGKDDVDRRAALQEFRKEMDELGVSHEIFGKNHPVREGEEIHQTPDGARHQKRVSEHPLQSGHYLGNVLIAHHDGRQMISYRSTDPALANSSLSQLIEKHGPDNVELRDDGVFWTKTRIEERAHLSPLSYNANQVYSSFDQNSTQPTKAYIRSSEGFWVDKAGQTDRDRAENYASGRKDQALVVNQATGSLLSRKGVDYLVSCNKSGGMKAAEILRKAGLDPASTDDSFHPSSDVLIKIKQGVLLSGEKLKASASKMPLTQKYLKSQIYLQNYQDKTGRPVGTGNYSTLEARERAIQIKFPKEPPGKQYARLYGSLVKSQRDQLNMPVPASEYARYATPPSSRVDRSKETPVRSPGRTPGPDVPIRSIESPPSSARQMSRPPRATSYGI